MSYILNIATAVPENCINYQDVPGFYARAFDTQETSPLIRKVNLLNKKTKIKQRYSCIPDYLGVHYALFTDNNFEQSVERRMELYKDKIVPLAAASIDNVLAESKLQPADFTHLITVSCTGLLAPGLEFLVAEKYGMQHTEKTAVNFLGCYAALKAIKQAHYIAQTDPYACILIVCAELCSLHFKPSAADEDIVSGLLFADGAASVIVCGNESGHIKNKTVLHIDKIGSAYLPDTAHLMSWDISSSAFRMHLSAEVTGAIKKDIAGAVTNFLGDGYNTNGYWAIHPGGVKILEACMSSLNLTEKDLADSMGVLEDYGNMSSPTILFVLNRIFATIREATKEDNKQIFSCAFGPGLNVEMIAFSAKQAHRVNGQSVAEYAV